MLQLTNGAISEFNGSYSNSGNLGQVDNACVNHNWPYYSYPYTNIYWNYPVYVYEDKTKKAIEVLKALEADKLIQVKSVNKFIELAEKISKLL